MNKEYKTFEELKEELRDKFEEFMYKANIELLDKVNQLETNRDEVLKFIDDEWYYDGTPIDKIEEILERGKE